MKFTILTQCYFVGNILLILLTSSCTITPTHRIYRIDRCEKVREQIYCEDNTQYDVGYYSGYSVYDEPISSR